MPLLPASPLPPAKALPVMSISTSLAISSHWDGKSIILELPTGICVNIPLLNGENRASEAGIIQLLNILWAQEEAAASSTKPATVGVPAAPVQHDIELAIRKAKTRKFRPNGKEELDLESAIEFLDSFEF